MADPEGVRGSMHPLPVYNIFLPVKMKNTARLLQPEAIFDSKCTKTFGDRARSTRPGLLGVLTALPHTL